jgi:vitamin B12 transporter
MTTEKHMAIKKQLIRISAFLIFMQQILSTVAPVSAQTADEKNFLLMYFKEEELVVESSTRSPKPVSEVAENVTVVTASDIELMNAHTLADVLNTVTGVQTFMTGGPGQIASAYIQASDQRHVTVMIDGVVLNNIADNIVDLGTIPVQMIRKIEIIKGPASSAWGSALGGVVNVITKMGSPDSQGNMASASYGTKNSGDFRAETMGKQGKLGYYLTAGRLQSDGLTPHFNVSDNNAYTKLTYDLTDNTSVLFSLGYGNNSRGAGEDTVYDLSYGNVMELTHSTLAVNSILAKDMELNVSIRSIHQEFAMWSAGSFVSNYKYTDKGYGSSAKLTWRNANNTIVFGADYDNKTLKSDLIAGGEQGLIKSALYANDTMTFGKLSITPGIRFDTTNSNGDAASPSLGITYGLVNNTLIRVYAANGFNIPPLAYTYGDGSTEISNPDLKAEMVRSYQAGVETSALKYAWVKLMGFRNEIHDAINVESASTGLNIAENNARQRRQGVELEAKTLPVYNVSLTAGADFIDAKDLESGQRLQYVPTRVYDLGLLYDDEHAFKALLKGRYIDWNADPLSSYPGEYNSFIFELNMIKKIHQHMDTSLEAFLNLHNILNGNQYLLSIYPNPERWFEGGIRYKF